MHCIIIIIMSIYSRSSSINGTQLAIHNAMFGLLGGGGGTANKDREFGAGHPGVQLIGRAKQITCTGVQSLSLEQHV